MTQALTIYRQRYRPSPEHPEPYVILGVNVIAADSDDEATFLASSGREASASLRRGLPIQLPPPSREFVKEVVPFGRLPIEELTSIAMIGAPATVEQGLQTFADATGANELMVVSHIYDHAARVRSYEITASLMESPQARST
jgi:alkanesulfonate monooxygenase SsuD/methylene tetrahydromethanopterin reductase-like flavin-dependent oxidoreductase (luciferase family)